ncbi:MAG TPA: formyl transferase [Terriglobales bacterium]|nr:formyl transferase [Terriglobales bacterium]
MRRRRNMLKRYGPWRTVNRLLLNWYRSRFESTANADTFEKTFPATEYKARVPVVTVSNINDQECIATVIRHAPQLIAICGTSVVKPAVFGLAPAGAINIHTGITPEYRSADPIFWALYNGDHKNVGVTIHFVDSGIDTGPIIHQASVPVYGSDTLNSIYVRCIVKGAELYLQTLDEIAAGTVTTIDRSHVKGRAFYSIDIGILQYMLCRLRFWRLKRHLPPGRPADGGSATEAQH